MTTEYFPFSFLFEISFTHFLKHLPRISPSSKILRNSAMAPPISLLSALESCEFADPLSRNSSSQLKSRCRNGVVMKRRARFDRRARRRNAVERKVRTLKKLIPNCESMGVERLFRETADYIVALQMRVKVMQIVVGAMTSSGSEDE